MTYSEFAEKYDKFFGTDELCEVYLFDMRWGEKFKCPKCGHNECFKLKTRHLYQCKSCRHQSSTTAGTILDKTKTRLIEWLYVIYVAIKSDKLMSVRCIEKEIKVSHDTACRIRKRIQSALDKKGIKEDDTDKAIDIITYFENLFETITPNA